MKLHSDDAGKFLLRLAVGGLILFHGVSKLSHGVDWIVGMLQEMGLPGVLAYGALVGEVLAPLLLIIGFKTRLAALVVAIDMVFALILVMGKYATTVKESGGGWGIEIEAFFLLGALALFFMGGGKYSVSKGQGSWE